MRSEADVVVIGGGVIGTSIAYYLSRDGYRVSLFERRELACGPSGANPGAITTQTKKPGIVLQQAICSARVYSTLSSELEYDLQYERPGGMVLFESDEDRPYMEYLVQKQREAGIPLEVLSGDEARKLVPALSPEIAGATFCPNDAHLNTHRLTMGFARAARRLGAEVFTYTPVTAIDMHGGRVAGVQSSKGKVSTSWVINATGVAAGTIGKMVGVEHQIIPRRGQVLITEKRRDVQLKRMSCASSIIAKHGVRPKASGGSTLGLGASVRPTSEGNVILGTTAENWVDDISLNAEAARAIPEYIIRILPGLKGARVVRGWAGLRPFTPSDEPILGSDGGPEGYLVAAGHGGDGVAAAPLTGSYMAKLVSAGKDAPTLEEFMETL